MECFEKFYMKIMTPEVNNMGANEPIKHPICSMSECRTQLMCVTRLFVAAVISLAELF